jgi:hypothetical protein
MVLKKNPTIASGARYSLNLICDFATKLFAELAAKESEFNYLKRLKYDDSKNADGNDG